MTENKVEEAQIRNVSAGYSPSYQERIDRLREKKLEFNKIKIETRGYYDNDDHGYIPLEHSKGFEIKPTHPNGGVYGAKAIGEHWKRWLTYHHPVYINPMSALAGAWCGTVPGVGGWKPEDRPTHLYELHKKYNFVQPGIGAMNHMGPDLKIGLSLGFKGLLEKVRYYRDQNRPKDTSFYDCEEDTVIGMLNFIRRHVEEARKIAAEATNQFEKDNLTKIADVNEWLLENPPRTLREAIQFLCWFQTFDRMYFYGGAMGQLDELLRPYYEHDEKEGILPCDEEIVWYIASLFINDTHYSQIGGPHPADGHDVSSKMSFLILEAIHALKIPINVALRLHDNYNPELLRKAVTYLFEDGTGVDYSCSGGLDKAFTKNGFPLQLARMRAKVGCNWTALPGIEYCLQDISRVCLVKPFVLAFDEMMEDLSAPKSMEELWRRYQHHLAIAVDLMKDGLDWHMEHQADNTPEIVLNLFCHGPIERGLDSAAGGLDIYNLNSDGVGLATVADSFAAVEQRVCKEGKISWERLYEVLKKNYEGEENIRLMLKNIPRFGTGGSRADDWAKKIMDTYVHLMKSTPTKKGYNVIPGGFSHGIVHALGRNVPATPNGRFSGEQISHNVDPDPGFMKGGNSAPTAKASAVAYVQPGYGNSAPLQIDFDKQLALSMGGLEAIEKLLLTHNKEGGTLVNINILSKEKLLEAHADPSKYPDLVVRVTGYSAFFASLSPVYRQQVVDRMLAEN